MVRLLNVTVPVYFEQYVRGKLEELDYVGASSTKILVENSGSYNEFDFIDEVLWKYGLEHVHTSNHTYGKYYHVRRKANG